MGLFVIKVDKKNSLDIRMSFKELFAVFPWMNS